MYMYSFIYTHARSDRITDTYTHSQSAPLRKQHCYVINTMWSVGFLISTLNQSNPAALLRILHRSHHLIRNNNLHVPSSRCNCDNNTASQSALSSLSIRFIKSRYDQKNITMKDFKRTFSFDRITNNEQTAKTENR